MLADVREMVSFLWPQSSQFSLQRKHRCISKVFSIICEWQGCTKIHKHPSVSTKKSRCSYGRKEKHPEMHREHGAWSAVSAGAPSIHCSREKQPVGMAEKLFSSPLGAFIREGLSWERFLNCALWCSWSPELHQAHYLCWSLMCGDPQEIDPQKGRHCFRKEKKIFLLLIRWNC